MGEMKTSKVLYGLFIFLIALSLAFAFVAYNWNPEKALVDFSVAVVGFIVALLALDIALRTYTSIDSVNAITKMDGNILDNERYVTSLPELLTSFTAVDSASLSEDLFESIENQLKAKTGSAIQLADTLQYLVDVIVIFPAIFNSDHARTDDYDKRMRGILKSLEKSQRKFVQISKGSSIQITEVIKLFKAVVSYQRVVASGRLNVHSDLLHVRGEILRNPVTRTVYNNYVGLYYNKKGMHTLQKALNESAVDLLSIDNLEELISSLDSLSSEDKEQAMMYFEFAKDSLEKALKISHDDIMWPGFINYNLGRTCFFLNLLSEGSIEWQSYMADAIKHRAILNRLIEDIFEEHHHENNCQRLAPHLRNFFYYQEELARLVSVNLMLVSHNIKRSDISYRGNFPFREASRNSCYDFLSIEGFSKISKYQDDIRARIEGHRSGGP